MNIPKKPKFRTRFWSSKHGLAFGEYVQMILAQQNKCAICRREETATMKGALLPLAVDHDHKTGKARELLCRSCNTALGLLREDRDTVISLIRYLDKHAGRETTPTLTLVPAEATK